MLPNPLHPAVVHFPVVLVSLAPLFAAGALWAIRRGARPVRAWGLATAILAALFLSSWAAVQTGEAQEDRVEEVLADEDVMHVHEEAAERFLYLVGGVLAIGLVGFAGGRLGGSARVAATVGTLAALGAGLSVGRSGGELVYRHGAANAYVRNAAADGTAGVAATRTAPRSDDDDEHDER